MAVPLPITDLAQFVTAISTERVAVIDFETSDIRPRVAAVVGVGIYLPWSDRAFYLNCGHAVVDSMVPRFKSSQLAGALQAFVGNPLRKAIFHNAPFDLRMLFRLGCTVRCLVADTLVHTHRLDENLRSYGEEPTLRHDMDKTSFGLKELTQIFFRKRPPRLDKATGGFNTLDADPQRVAKYCSLDVRNTWALYRRARQAFKLKPRLHQLIRRFDDRNNLPLAKMMWEGIEFDGGAAQRHYDANSEAIQVCREHIWKLLNASVALETPADLRKVLKRLKLVEDLGYDPLADPWATPSDPREDYVPSIASDVLAHLFDETKDEHKRLVLALILAKGSLRQRITAFIDPLTEQTRYTSGRIYLDRFSSTLATTRFSSSPNVQNLPKRADKVDDPWEAVLPDGCKVDLKTRDLVIAKPGHKLVSIDLTAAEPRYLAMAFQRTLEEKDESFHGEVRELNDRRREKYGKLIEVMEQIADRSDARFCPKCGTKLRLVLFAGRYRDYCDTCDDFPFEIKWPKYKTDPLFEVFKSGGDPYDAMLTVMDKEGHQQAVANRTEKDWLNQNRGTGKLAFLALAFGASADTLAPQLKWSVERTEQAIKMLKGTYATLDALSELTIRRVRNLGFVRSLTGRPRRLNGYYELAGTEPLTVQFRLKDQRFSKEFAKKRKYLAKILPLKSYRWGVQAFIQEAGVEREDGTIATVLASNPDGTIKYISKHDPWVKKPQFNRPPFRNLPHSIIEWVRDEHNLVRYLAKQERAQRQAFNAISQVTGADHLRWLMNEMDRELSRSHLEECKLILTVHDSLMYEVPVERMQQFTALALPVVTKRPSWATLSIEAEIEIGQSFGQMKKLKQETPTVCTLPRSSKRRWPIFAAVVVVALIFLTIFVLYRGW